MDPKAASRSKRKFTKKHSSGKGNYKSHPTPDGNDENKGRKQNNLKENQTASSTSTQVSSSTAKSEISTPTQEKIIIPNLKKETEEIAQLTQKYGRRRIVSTWTRDFDIPQSKDSDNEEGADFKELISGYSNFSAGHHLLLKEEQEWLKEAELCESPFSLDLKLLETGISCIPFYERQTLSEKSFNPKEVQIMIKDAEFNEIVYKEMKSETQDTQKVLLSKENKNNDDLIRKSFMNDDILSMKSDKNTFFGDFSRTGDEVNSIQESKKEVLHSNDSKPSMTEQISNKQVSEIPFNNTDLVRSTPNCSSDFNPKINDILDQRKNQRQQQGLRNSLSSSDSQNYKNEESNRTGISNREDVIENNETKNPVSSDCDYVIQSLAPRGQRRPRSATSRNSEDNAENNSVKSINDSNFSEFSFTGLNLGGWKTYSGPSDNNFEENNYNSVTKSIENSNVLKVSSTSELKVDNDFWSVDLELENEMNRNNLKSEKGNTMNDKEVLKTHSRGEASVHNLPLNKKDEVTLIQDEINNSCNEISSAFPNKSKNELSDSRKDNEKNAGLNEIKSSEEKMEEFNHNTTHLKNTNVCINSDPKTIVSGVIDSVCKIDLKINKGNDHACNSQSFRVSSLWNAKKSSTNDSDDDLDFLLGLKKPSSDVSLSKTSECVSSSLSILEEKLLKGTVASKDTNTFNNIMKQDNNKVMSLPTNNPNNANEDLDEWLDSVLGS